MGHQNKNRIKNSFDILCPFRHIHRYTYPLLTRKFIYKYGLVVTTMCVRHIETSFLHNNYCKL